MIQTSSEFKQAIAAGRVDFIREVALTLANGTELVLENAQLWSRGVSFDDSLSNDDSFSALGAAPIGTATVIINNIYDTYTDYDFNDADVKISVGLNLNGTIEMIEKGRYTVESTSYNGSTITLSCVDRMHLLDRPYSGSTLIYPASLDTIVRDICTRTGVTLATTNFPNKSFVVQTRPIDEAITYRQILAYAALIAGCYARINNEGKLELKWFNRTALESAKTQDNVSGVAYITSIYNKDISVDDVVITGVRTEVDVERTVPSESGTSTETVTETYLYGNEGYVIGIEKNPFITIDNMQSVARFIGDRIIGLSFRKASVTHTGDPSIEAGDVAIVIDRKNKRYPLLISRTSLAIGSSQQSVSAAQTPKRNSAARFSKQTQDFLELHKRIIEEKNDRERIEADLAEAIESASGMYETQVSTPSGGTITYLHNKPLLADSDTQIMISDVGVTVTPDGGDHWYGLTVDGNLIANILAVTGIHADWINTGQLNVSKGGREMLFVDVDAGVVRISGNASVIEAGDTLDTAIKETSGTTTRTIMDNANAYGLGWKVNYSRWSVANNGKCYYHGYAANGVASDVDGWVVWKGEKVIIPHTMGINPNNSMRHDRVNYSVYRTSDVGSETIRPFHDVSFNETTGKWEGNSYTIDGTPNKRAEWTWNEDTDIILASYLMPSGEGAIYGAQLFTPPKKYSELPEKAMEYSSSELSDFAETVTAEIDDIKDQLDGVIDTYYYSYAPTLNNIPASEWTTDALKADHEGDLFLDTSTGKSYRFVKDNGVWQWKEIPDTASAQALQLAQTAKDTADGKRRVFIVQPTPPYDTGDLWMQGTDGDILVCTTAKAQGAAFTEADWSKLNKYTDEASVTTMIEEQISTIEIGGRNLLWDTNAPTLEPVDGFGSRWFANPATLPDNGAGTEWVELSDSPVAEVKYGAKFVCTATGGQVHGLCMSTITLKDGITNGSCVEMKEGQQYTLSWWAKGDTVGATMYAAPSNAGSTSPRADREIHTIDEVSTWKRYSTTFTWTGEDSYRAIYFVSSYNLVATVWMCAFQLETGSIATDWSDHPRVLTSYGGRNLIHNTNDKLSGEIDVTDLASLPNINGYYNDGEHYGNIEMSAGMIEYVEHGVKITATSAAAPYMRFGTATSGTSIDRANGLYGLEAGQTYTLSFDYRFKLFNGSGTSATTSYYLAAYLYTDIGDAAWNQYTDKRLHLVAPGESRSTERSGRGIFTFTLPKDANRLYLTIRPSATTSSYFAAGDFLEVRNLKLEKGNVATEWTPAPEDTDSALLDARKSIPGRNYLLGTGTPIERYSNTTSGNAQRQLYSTNAMQTLTDLDFKVGDKVTISFDWELTGVEEDAYGSFRIEEYGKTSSSEYGYLGIATTVTPSATYMSGHESVTLTLTAATVLIKALNLRMDNVIGSLKISNMKLERGELATPWIAANEDAYTQSNGTNMLRGTNVLARLAAGGWEKGLWRASGSTSGTRTLVDIEDDSIPKIKRGVRYQSTAYAAGGTAGLGIGQNGVPNIIPGKTYTMSCYAKGTGVVCMTYGVSSWEPQGMYIDTEEFVRLSMTFTIRELAAYADLTAHKSNAYFAVTGEGADVTLCGFKMEEGLTATEWCEAPEDIEDEIAGYVESIGEQLDGKAETWYQPTDPSTDWTAEEKAAHKGDLWYNTANGANTTWYWNGSTWQQQNAPKAVFDEIDGKATVYTGAATPSDPQEKDLWFKGTDEGIYTYVGGTWVEYNKYTDDTLAKQNVKTADVEYYSSTSPTELKGGSWSTTAPEWTQGKYIWTRTKWTKGNGTSSYSNPTCITGNTGAPGTAATVQYLEATAAAFVKNQEGTLSPSSVTFSAKQRAGTNTPSSYSGRFIIAESTNGTSWTNKYTSSANEASKTYTPSANTVRMIRCTLYQAGGTTTSLDVITVPIVSDGTDGGQGAKGDKGDAGNDAYTVILTNENHTFVGDTTKAIESSAVCNVVAYKGASRIAATIGSITGLPTGMTVSVTNNGTTSARFTVAVTTAMVTRNGTLTVPVTVEDKTFNMIFTYSLALKGETGKGIQSVKEYYALSNSTSAPADSAFSEGIKTPTSSNRYLWNYELVTYTDSSTKPLDKHIVAMYGEQGKGITAITDYYALSSTTSAPADSAFSTTVKTVTPENKYLWNYEQVTYTEGDPKKTDKRIIGVYGEPGDPGKGISSVTELYYCSSSAGVPDKPEKHVTTDSTTIYNAWNKACPTWTTTYKYYFTCSEVLYDDGTRNWTDVSTNQGLTTSNSTANAAQTTAAAASSTATQAKNTADTAKETADAAAQIIGGYTIKWNVSSFAGNTNNGEGYICKLDPLTGTQSDAAGWAMWNGTKRTIPKNIINPDVMAPFNTPIYVVCRLTAADAAAGQNTLVWYNAGWKYLTKGTNAATADQAVGDWTWAAATDMVIGKFVEPASEAAFVETEIYNPPLMYNQTSATGFTVSGAQAAATAAGSAASAAQNAADAAQSAADDAHKLAVLTRLIGSCPTGATARVKVITCSESFDEYVTGMRMTVTFTNANSYTAGALQFNVNGKGVKSVAVAGEITGAANPFIWTAGAKITFEYDGKYWIPQNLQPFEAQSDSPATTKAKDTKLAPTEGATREETALGFALYKGARVVVKFTNMNAVAGPTLNVGGTGAKQIRANGANIAASSPYGWKDGARIEFIFDGTYWQVDTRTGDAVEIVDLELTQEEVMKRLTNNYAAEAFVIENDQIYINMSYLRAGMIKIGGANNTNGLLKVLDADGNVVGKWDFGNLLVGNMGPDGSEDESKAKFHVDNSRGYVDIDYLMTNGNMFMKGAGTSYIYMDEADAPMHSGLTIGGGSPLSASSTPKVTGGVSLQGGNMLAALGGMLSTGVSNTAIGGLIIRRGDNSSGMDSSANNSGFEARFYRPLAEAGETFYDRFYIKVYDDGDTVFKAGAGGVTVKLLTANGNAVFNNNLTVEGAKNRLYKTEDYGKRYLYSYETPAPTFGDIGEGVIGEDGLCYVYLDPVFAETITTTQYQVFLQVYGEGQVHVKERKANYFVVSGTPGMSFGWELKARQKDLDSLRLDKSMGIKDVDIRNEVDYAGAAASHINALLKEREETA